LTILNIETDESMDMVTSKNLLVLAVDELK